MCVYMCMYVCTVCICVLMHVRVYCVCVVGRYRIASNAYGIFDKNGNVLRLYARPYVPVSTPVAKSGMPVPVNAHACTCTMRRSTPILHPYTHTLYNVRSAPMCHYIKYVHSYAPASGKSEIKDRVRT